MLIINLSVPEPVAFNTSLRGPVLVLSRERLSRHDAESAKLDEPFIACNDRVLELASSLSAAASTESMHFSQVVTSQTYLFAEPADLKAGRSSVV